MINQISAINLLVIIQIMALGMVFIEREEFNKQLKNMKTSLFLARFFMLSLPTLTIISLLIRPLES